MSKSVYYFKNITEPKCCKNYRIEQNGRTDKIKLKIPSIVMLKTHTLSHAGVTHWSNLTK